MEIEKIFKKYFIPVQNEPTKVNSSICKKCNGKCCHNLGCYISPYDFISVTKENIRNLINESKCVSIDWWEGNPLTDKNTEERFFFLRIKNKNSFTVDPSFGGTCSILTDKGCPLSFAYRPKGARDLIPNINECDCLYTKQQCAIEWASYNNILEELYQEYVDAKGYSPNTFPLLEGVDFTDIFNTLFGANQ